LPTWLLQADAKINTKKQNKGRPQVYKQVAVLKYTSERVKSVEHKPEDCQANAAM
jgi:hypothetical protein